MLTIVGTLWPLLGFPASILLASMTPSPAWRWAALLAAPALVCATHYWIVLPACLKDGNMLAAGAPGERGGPTRAYVQKRKQMGYDRSVDLLPEVIR